MTSPEHLIRQILLYLLAHPEAKDTVDGIRTWWISKSEDMTSELVASAIDELVRKGWLIEREGVSSPKVYGMNTAAQSEIRAFVEAEVPPSPRQRTSRTT